jgi:carnosine synthase
LPLQRAKGRAELTFMMEQYLDGPEVDVDVVLNAEGDVVYGNVTDNWPTIEPYFNETGAPPLGLQIGALPADHLLSGVK